MKKLNLRNLMLNDMYELSLEEKRNVMGGACMMECYCMQHDWIVYVPCDSDASCAEECGDILW